MTTLRRPIARYHGGKWNLAPWIISHFPKHKVYTEVFGGVASVLLRKPKVYAEIYNDQWDLVVNLLRVLRDRESAIELQRLLRLTPFSRSEYEFCKNIPEDISPIEKARMALVLSFMSFGSGGMNPDYSTGFRSNSNRSGTSPATDWKNYSDCVPYFCERLSTVTIENRHYADVLQQHDKPHTLHYIDPPYDLSGRNCSAGKVYAHEFADKDHYELRDNVEGLKGMVIISGYDTELYQLLYKGWKRETRKARTDGADKVETLFFNERAASMIPGKSLFH